MPNASAILTLVCAGLAAGASGAPLSQPGPMVVAPARLEDPLPHGTPTLQQPAAARSLWCDNVLEMETTRRSGVTSAWLSNGVRVHHLKLDRRPGVVVVTIALSGAKLLEDATTRGISDVAANVLDDWDAAAPEASTRERMAGRDIRIDAAATQDAITLRLAGSVSDLAAALSVAHDLLTHPTVTDQGVEQAKERVVQELSQRAADPRAPVSDAINSAIIDPTIDGRGDARLGPPDDRHIKAISTDQVRAWLARHLKEGGAPMEVAFVGDLALSDALRLTDTTLGTLPTRARVGRATNDTERRAPLARRGPINSAVEIPGVEAGRATVVCGCFGPDMAALNDQRALRAAVRLAMTKVKPRLAIPGFAVGPSDPSGGVYVSAFAGLGMVLVTATVDAGHAPAAATVIHEELRRLADAPPTADDLAPVARELGKSVEELERDLRYWSGALARCDALGITPDDIASAASFYKAITPDQVHDAMKRYLLPDREITLTIHGPAKA